MVQMGATHEETYMWSPLVRTTSLKNYGSPPRKWTMCVQKSFNECNCVQDDLPYHSHLKGACHVFLLKTFYVLQNHQPVFFSPIEKISLSTP